MVYMQKIIAEVRTEGIHVRDEDVARLSPLKFAHINFHGRYSFALPAGHEPVDAQPRRS
ncbi:Tn3 family transposase [Streptomyces marokkonensis]|uniref:Tn3 family transposase n=1 Tax=Streptomyces marokkonensis TaxID=324855 RepID=A0ABW6QG58_9ACTN